MFCAYKLILFPYWANKYCFPYILDINIHAKLMLYSMFSESLVDQVENSESVQILNKIKIIPFEINLPVSRFTSHTIFFSTMCVCILHTRFLIVACCIFQYVWLFDKRIVFVCTCFPSAEAVKSLIVQYLCGTVNNWASKTETSVSQYSKINSSEEHKGKDKSC